jgi:alkylation response protein AidB-like acyl-CoA dehydrogenase
MTKTLNLQEILAEHGPAIGKDAAVRDANDGFIGPNYDILREAKIFSAQIPTEIGGGGVSHAEMCEFIRGLAHHCPSTALTLAMHQHLVATAIANDRAGRPGRALLDKVAGGELILISTGANDWLDSNGSAEAVEGGYRITAFKPFASGSPKGDVLVTSAAYDGPNGPEVLHFPVPLKSEGVTIMSDWDTIGMRATGSQTVKLENVFVPEAAIALRRPRSEFHMAFAVIATVAMPLIMSAYVGTAEAAAAIARNRAKTRIGDPVTPYLLGEMENLLATAQMARADMIRIANNLDFTPTVQMASDVLSRKTICANAVIATTGLERLLRDAHGAQFHPLPEKRQQLFTGRTSMGLDPVYDAA